MAVNRRRSNVFIAIGAVVFLVGGSGALLILSRGSHAAAQAPAAASSNKAVTVVTTPQVANPGGAPSTPIGAAALHIPSGMVAVAVQLGSIPAVGGYPAPGDFVDVYGQFTKTQPSGTAQKLPMVQLELANVQVLAVHQAPPSTTPTTAVMVLAVSPASAERLIYLTSFESLYTALVPAHSPVPLTPGRGAANILAPS